VNRFFCPVCSLPVLRFYSARYPKWAIPRSWVTWCHTGMGACMNFVPKPEPPGLSRHPGLHEIPRICSSELLGKIGEISVHLWLKAFISHRFHRWTQIKRYLPKNEIHSRDFILYLGLSDRTTDADITPTPHNVTTPDPPKSLLLMRYRTGCA
jgi:hypothetical protein